MKPVGDTFLGSILEISLEGATRCRLEETLPRQFVKKKTEIVFLVFRSFRTPLPKQTKGENNSENLQMRNLLLRF